MNHYYLRVIAGSSTILDVTVIADGVTYSNTGAYVFWIFNENGGRIDVAYYPVEHTIIESIEYGME
jgi:hypothetical protein